MCYRQITQIEDMQLSSNEYRFYLWLIAISVNLQAHSATNHKRYVIKKYFSSYQPVHNTYVVTVLHIRRSSPRNLSFYVLCFMLHIGYHSRFFVRVGHETTYAAIGNHHFVEDSLQLINCVFMPTWLRNHDELMKYGEGLLKNRSNKTTI